METWRTRGLQSFQFPMRDGVPGFHATLYLGHSAQRTWIRTVRDDEAVSDDGSGAGLCVSVRDCSDFRGWEWAHRHHAQCVDGNPNCRYFHSDGIVGVMHDAL
jgi:hypothetical protein